MSGQNEIYQYRVIENPLGDNIVKQGVVTMQELLVSSLTQTDSLIKLLIEKGLITEKEFMEKLSVERARYQEMLQEVQQKSV